MFVTTWFIQIPENLFLPKKSDGDDAGPDELLTYVYGAQPPHLPVQPASSSTTVERQNYTTKVNEAVKFYSDKTILTATNKEVTRLNERVMDRLQGDEKIFCSADSVDQDNAASAAYTTEFLNCLEFSGVPPHRLQLKLGCVIMLLRNLCNRDGLCRILLTKMGHRVLQGIILTGKYKYMHS